MSDKTDGFVCVLLYISSLSILADVLEHERRVRLMKTVYFCGHEIVLERFVCFVEYTLG